MKVGLDTISFNPLNLDPMGFLDITVEYGLEGLQLLGTRTFIDKPAEYSDHFLSKLRAHNLYLELYGARINPKDSGKTVDDLVQDWIPLFPAAARMGARRGASSPSAAPRNDKKIASRPISRVL